MSVWGGSSRPDTHPTSHPTAGMWLLLRLLPLLAVAMGFLHPGPISAPTRRRDLTRVRVEVNDRRGVLGELAKGSLGVLLLTWASSPAGARVVANLEQAREIGERRREELEKAKGPLVILPEGVR